MLVAEIDETEPNEPSADDKIPRTERGRRTARKLIDAAALEFGEHGFHDASITGITRRAGTALGSFYTYFSSKEEIFHALVEDLTCKVVETSAIEDEPARPMLDREREISLRYLAFAREHKEIYRIIDQCEFVEPEGFRNRYELIAQRIFERLQDGIARGELRSDLTEAHAWAIMGMSSMLGLRYGSWGSDESLDEIADIANSLLRNGIALPQGEAD
ncbi:TetR/AcrR family transcriptional regulator [Novosphingobium colocasiae]|uniref:TetR/AcrR family transcriptional regulator n=1 Tax=Novosphingobium colocasiae TaxID=1256513 RepID=UPI0035AE9A12